ncbi:MAG TPA: dynamin family protein [Pseudonocardiaceae bacterium]|nr:dynamin family protein [Pseudonocardiaceae bacterium]
MSVMTDPAARNGTDTGSTTAITELLDRLRLLTDAANRPDLGTHLAQARIRVTDPRLRIVITGQTGQGMSSLVAAITGAPMTATDTNDPVVVSYSDAEFVRLVPAAGAKADAGSDPVPRVEIGAPNDLLVEGVVLIDTPGTSGLDTSRTGVVLSLLPAAGAVLFVSDASQEYTEPEIAYLRQIRQLCPTVIGVISKIDLYPRWVDIQRANRTHLTNAGLDIPLLPLSSAMGEIARRSGDAELAVESGVPQLVDLVRHRVIGATDVVLRNAVVNDVRFVSDHLAMACNAELDALNDPSCGAELVARLRDAWEAADRLRQRTANWQVVLGDGATELTVEVEHDLRHRLRSVIREAEADIMTSDPAKRWDEFGSWLDGRIAASVQDNFVLAHTRCRDLAEKVATRFAAEGRLAVPELYLDYTGTILDPVQSLEPLDSRKAGIAQRAISSVRGSYGGVLMVGLMTGLAGLALVNPWSIGAGVLLGANTFWEDRKSQTSRRQAEAKAAVARLMDDVIFQVGKESKYRLREAQRTLRDHFTTVATEMLRSADDAWRAAQEANQIHTEHRASRIAEVHNTLSDLRQLRVRAAALVPARVTEETR